MKRHDHGLKVSNTYCINVETSAFPEITLAEKIASFPAGADPMQLVANEDMNMSQVG